MSLMGSLLDRMLVEKTGRTMAMEKTMLFDNSKGLLTKYVLSEDTLLKGHLKKVIPHRGPAVKINGFFNGTDEKFGFRYLDSKDHVFKGHYPGNPLCPNDQLDEIFNISAAVYFKLTMPEVKGFPAVVKKGGVSYKNPVRPGDLLRAYPGLEKNLRNKFFIFSGTIINQRNEIVAIYENVTGAAI